uniref:Peptidase S74 domain-containing protein n=1 Tax=viral metagenome TaxID=1070528 RepID=A0A6C0CFW7_9ZZZZ
MDYNRIQIDSIGIGLEINSNLDFIKYDYINTRLAVAETIPPSAINDTNKLNHIYKLVVSDNNTGVNISRTDLNNNTDSAFVVNGNILCTGAIHASNITISSSISPTSTLSEIINEISANSLFYQIRDYTQYNIYTNYNVTLGTINDANNNTNALKIAKNCNGSVSNIQLVIANNEVVNYIPSQISLGIIGNSSDSPAHIITSFNMPLHFNVNNSNQSIDSLYINPNGDQINKSQHPTYVNSNYPQLAIDTNNVVLVNLDTISQPITYINYTKNTMSIDTSNITEFPNFYVNGTMFANKIIMYDYFTQTNKNLDSIYVRQAGLTLNANQIYGGTFNKAEFYFNSNIQIGDPTSSYKLNVYGDAKITSNLTTSNITTTDLKVLGNFEVSGNNNGTTCDFNRPVNFSSTVTFNDQINADVITVNNLNVAGNITYGGNLLGSFSNSSNSSLISSITSNLNLTGILGVGVKVQNVDIVYNNNILNVYKQPGTANKNKFEIFLQDLTIQASSKAYIGHNELNSLCSQTDNSLIILTQANSTWNNIYFYAGKNKTDLKQLVPNLAIMENNKIGINTIKPTKTLEVNGEILAKDYYVTDVNSNTYKCKLPVIYTDNSINIDSLNVGVNQFLNTSNRKQLNVVGGINSYDGYYENELRIATFKYINSNSAWNQNAHIGIGVSNKDSNITIPLQIKNNVYDQKSINNSVISFYRASVNSVYSGIDFCDDPSNLNDVNKNKWYIYKKHVANEANFAGPLQIGYMMNSYNPSKSCINFYYNRFNSTYFIDINNSKTYNENINTSNIVNVNGNVKIIGDLNIEGSVNITGNYKFNNNNITFAPNPLTTIINKIYAMGNEGTMYLDTVLTSNNALNISTNIYTLSSNINSNVSNIFYNSNYNINIPNSQSNSLLASNISNLQSNVNANINNYLYKANDIIVNSNVSSIFGSTINTYIQNNYVSNLTDFHIYSNIIFNSVYVTSNIIIQNSSNNLISSSNTFLISSNIYSTLSNISTTFKSYLNIAYNYNNLTQQLYYLTLNTYASISNSYSNITSTTDINGILTTGNSNVLISSNIYVNSSNYYKTLSNIDINNNNYINDAFSNLSLSSNIYSYSSNKLVEINRLSVASWVNSNLLYYSTINCNISTNNYVISSNINNSIITKYGQFYTNLLTPSVYQPISITSSTTAQINFNNTNTIYNNIITERAIYLPVSKNNSNFSSNIYNTIITYDRTSPVLLTLYTLLTIQSGITDIYTIITNNKNLYASYKTAAISLLSNYNYLVLINDVIKTANDNNINLINYITNLIDEIYNDIIYLNNFIQISNYNKYQFIDISYSITNKYIVFINKTYEYANSCYVLSDAINTLIGNNIANAISLIEVLNAAILNTNNALKSAWDVSLNITDFYNLVYSMNTIVKETEINTHQQDINTNNTDVIIVGNLIKLYPKNTLIVGYNSISSRWADSINDINKNSPFYTFNDNFDSCTGSFNCRGKTFMNISTPTKLSLKTCANIDINLVDTAERTGIDNSIIDNVKFKVSHITNRTSTSSSIGSYENNTLFEIIPKATSSPFLSCYTTTSNTNIVNIGSGQFYNNDTNYKCLYEDAVLHINDSTPNYLLKLTNISSTPVKIGIKQNNFLNNWDLLINNNFNFNFNNSNILNINSNNIITNTTLNVNSYSNAPSIILTNQYSNLGTIITSSNLNILTDFNINYTTTGVKYSLKTPIPNYEVQKTLFSVNSNIVTSNIIYNFSNVYANYIDVDNATNNFKFDINNLKYNLLPPIISYDSNLSYVNNNYETKTVNYDLSSGNYDNGNLTNINLSYIVPSSISYLFSSVKISIAGENVNILTNIAEPSYDSSDYGSNLLVFTYHNINFSNIIVYNKYSQFIINEIDVTLTAYSHNLLRYDNSVPTSIYNNYSNIISTTVTNNHFDNPQITINNTFHYLRTDTSYGLSTSSFVEYVEKQYELILFGMRKYIPINVLIYDIYDIYINNSVSPSIPITVPINLINTVIKLPTIKQQNIYNRFHNIYSYTNDYEIYLDNYKLLNIDEKGTLKTSGNIETNNIYLTGNIYNSKGVSLYDNVLSIIENISSNVNFELNTKNIILNPSVYNRDNYKGGVIINGDNMNPTSNNLFQINNFPDNNNFITLNSCTDTALIHFNTNFQNVNNIYKIGTNQSNFVISILNNSNTYYDNNLYISNNNQYTDAIICEYKSTTNDFNIYLNGLLYSYSDLRLKKDIKNIENALDKLCSLNGVTYNLIDDKDIDNSKRQTGLIAQEVEKVLPEAVIVNKDGLYNLAYGNMAGLIVEAIKELKKEIDIIKKKVF